jgi:hypothetical protein
VRRCVKACFAREAGSSAMRSKERLDECAGAAFALCPGYVDYVQSVDVGSLGLLTEQSTVNL